MLGSFVINCVVVTTTVMIHYEFLHRLDHHIPQLKLSARFQIVLGVLGALLAHTIEVWCFALVYFAMHHIGGWGGLAGDFDGSLSASCYFSFVTFTTVGYGDIIATGQLRYVAAIESLTGLVLITWTASYLFLMMQRHWK